LAIAKWLCLTLALLAALGYVLSGVGVLDVGNLETAEAPPGIAYILGGLYALGGFLILLCRRWLWIVGIVANTITILGFISFYYNRPSILFSGAGLWTKIAQFALQIGLFYLVIVDRRLQAQGQ
jgi:hypothetical protein